MGTWQGERAEKKIIKFADSLSVNAAAELLLWMSRSAAKNHHCVPKKNKTKRCPRQVKCPSKQNPLPVNSRKDPVR